MTSTLTRNIQTHNAEQYIEAFSEEAPDNMFLFIGRVQDWANGVPTSIDSVEETHYRVWDSMLSAKRITGNDVYLVIPRYDWANNTAYNHYDSASATMWSNTTPFYVRTSNRSVYKCIANNGTSNVEPTSTSTGEFTTADGYVWKFMYNSTAAVENKFLTDNYMPVQTLTSDDSSQQWLVQQATVDGAVKLVVVESGGSDYINNSGNFSSVTSSTVMQLDGSASSTSGDYVGYGIFISSGPGAGQLSTISAYDESLKQVTLATGLAILPTTSSQYIVSPAVEFAGDGSNLSAYSVVDTNGTDVDSIVIISEGTGYSQAAASIVGSPGSGAVLRTILSPHEGHGYDAVYELGGRNVMIHTVLSGSESNTVTTVNDFRRYGIVKNPLLASNGALALGDVYNLTERFTVVNVTNDGGFDLDEQVVSSVDSDTTYTVVQFANTNAANTAGILSVVNANGSPITVGTTITGANSGTTALVNNIQSSDFAKHSGRVLFVNNIDSVSRDASQREDFRITLKF